MLPSGPLEVVAGQDRAVLASDGWKPIQAGQTVLVRYPWDRREAPLHRRTIERVLRRWTEDGKPCASVVLWRKAGPRSAKSPERSPAARSRDRLGCGAVSGLASSRLPRAVR